MRRIKGNGKRIGLVFFCGRDDHAPEDKRRDVGCEIVHFDEDGCIYVPPRCHEGGTSAYYRDLEVGNFGCPYEKARYDVRYSLPHDVDLLTAEAMASTLRYLDDRLRALEATHGYPATLGQYIARVADAIGASAIIFMRDGNAEILSVRKGVARIDRRLRSEPETPRRQSQK